MTSNYLPGVTYFGTINVTTVYKCDCLSKMHIVCTKTEFNFIGTVYRHTHYLSIPSVSSVKC